MSLDKAYRLYCEAGQVHMDRLYPMVNYDKYKDALVATRDDRRKLTADCQYFSEYRDTAKSARSAAKAGGWVRHTETRLIYPGATDTTTIRYDVCGPCAQHLQPEGG